VRTLPRFPLLRPHILQERKVMERLHQIYHSIIIDDISAFFCLIIIGWFALGVLFALMRTIGIQSVGSGFIAITPTSLATLGVLGTFTGILIGLLDFDVRQVDNSVPELLAGLKIAFTTSIVGIAAAIAFRLLQAVTTSAATSQKITPESIHKVLEEIRDGSERQAQKSSEQLTRLREAISSDGDGSLLTQVQKLRTTTQDGHQELIQEFQNFAKHMTENNQKAIIEALKQVIDDFNQNLTEQFGENFKELNKAVHALVEWQGKYREHIERLEDRIDHALQAIEESKKALEAVKSHSERIPEMLHKLEPVLVGMHAQAEALNSQLEAIGELREKAIEAFPTIESNLEILTSKLTENVNRAVTISAQMLENWQISQDGLRQGYDTLMENAQNAQSEFTTQLENVLQQIALKLSEASTKHGELIQKSAQKSEEAVEASWKLSTEKMNTQFEKFDNELREELRKSLEALGQNLASLSEKFVADYTPLTEQLQNVLVLAHRWARSRN